MTRLIGTIAKFSVGLAAVCLSAEPVAAQISKPSIKIPTKPIIDRPVPDLKDSDPEYSVVETIYTCPSDISTDIRARSDEGWAVVGADGLRVLEREVQSANGYNLLICYLGTTERWANLHVSMEPDASDPYCRVHPQRTKSFGCRPEEDWLNKLGEESIAPSYRFNLDVDDRNASQRNDIWWGDTPDGKQILSPQSGAKLAIYRGNDPRRGTCSAATDNPVSSIPGSELTPGTIVCFQTDKLRYGYLEVISLSGSGPKTLNVKVKTFANFR